VHALVAVMTETSTPLMYASCASLWNFIFTLMAKKSKTNTALSLTTILHVFVTPLWLYLSLFLPSSLLSSSLFSQISGVPEKRADIEDAITARLSSQCSCSLDPALLLNGRFAGCTLPGQVTYRATIQGTSSLSSRELISLIQKWVNEDPVITVASVEMRVNLACPVDSIDDPQCSSAPASLSLPFIVGVVIGGVVMLAACSIAMVTAVFCSKRRKRKKYLASQSRNRNNK